MKRENLTMFDLEAAFKALDEIEMPVAEKGIRANKVNLQETFRVTGATKTDLLLEDYYDISDVEDLEQAKADREAEVAKAKLARIEKIVDLAAESEEDLLPSYVGKVIIQCPQCMTLFYKEEADIVKSETDEETVNVAEVCQHCGNESGYTLIGKVEGVKEEELVPEESVEEVPSEDDIMDLENAEEENVEEESTEENEEELDLTPVEDTESAEEESEEEKVEESLQLNESDESLTEAEDCKIIFYCCSKDNKNYTIEKSNLKPTEIRAEVNKLAKDDSVKNVYVSKVIGGKEIPLDKFTYDPELTPGTPEYAARNKYVDEALTEEVDKDLQAKLDAHNEYIKFLQEEIEKEEKALEEAKNDFIKEAIQRRIEVLYDELDKALPEEVKAETAEEPIVEEEVPAEEEANNEVANEETSEESVEEEKEEVKEALNEDFNEDKENLKKALGEVVKDDKKNRSTIINTIIDNVDEKDVSKVFNIIESKLGNVSLSKAQIDEIIAKLPEGCKEKAKAQNWSNIKQFCDFIDITPELKNNPDTFLWIMKIAFLVASVACPADGPILDVIAAIVMLIPNEFLGKILAALAQFEPIQALAKLGSKIAGKQIEKNVENAAGKEEVKESLNEGLTLVEDAEAEQKLNTVEAELKNSNAEDYIVEEKELKESPVVDALNELEAELSEGKLPREPQVFDHNGNLIKVKDPEILKIWDKVITQAEADGIDFWDNYKVQKQLIDKACTPEEIEKLKNVEFEDGLVRAAYESLQEDKKEVSDEEFRAMLKNPVFNEGCKKEELEEEISSAPFEKAIDRIEKAGEELTPEEQKQEEAELAEKEAPVELDQAEDFDEEKFNESVNKYLNDTYENVKCFEATGCKIENKKLVVEGIINFNSGKTRKTTFEFGQVELTENKIVLNGANKTLAETFVLTCNFNEKTLITEGFNKR